MLQTCTKRAVLARFVSGESQDCHEIETLSLLVAKRLPYAIVEIGVFKGGTLARWALMDPGLLIGIDVVRHSIIDELEPAIRGYMSGAFHFLQWDSRDPDCIGRVRELVGERGVDFLFIDGEHGYEDARLDFENYAPMVKKGGIVAFHDMAPRPDADKNEPARNRTKYYWQDLRRTKPTMEIVAYNMSTAYGDELGIGVVFV